MAIGCVQKYCVQKNLIKRCTGAAAAVAFCMGGMFPETGAAREIVIGGVPSLSWVNRIMDIMIEPLRPSQGGAAEITGLSYVQRPVIGNHELAILDVPLPDGNPPKKVVLDQPLALNVNIDPDGIPSLELEGESNVISRVVPVITENGELKLTFDVAVEASEPVTANLTLPALESLQHEARSRVEIRGLTSERLRLVESGGGVINASGQVRILNASVLNGHADLRGIEVVDDLLLRAGRHGGVKVNAQGAVLQSMVSRRAEACYIGEPKEVIPGEGAVLAPCPVYEPEENEKTTAVAEVPASAEV